MIDHHRSTCNLGCLVPLFISWHFTPFNGFYFQVNMLIVKFLQPPVGRVGCSVVVRSLPPGPTQSVPAVCCPTSSVQFTLGVRTLSNVSSLSARRTSLRPDTWSGSRVLLDPGTMWRFRVASRARSMSDNSASSDTSGWYNSLAELGPVRLCEQYLMGVQQLTEFPWWLSIAISTVMVRTLITLPLAAYQMVIIAKVSDRGHDSFSLMSRPD